MALATTCPQCKTSFRVVPDQLKLRRGYVRCGRCRHVFAGVDHLRYVDDAQLRAEARATGAERQRETDAVVEPEPDDAAIADDVEWIVVGAPDSDDALLAEPFDDETRAVPTRDEAREESPADSPAEVTALADAPIGETSVAEASIEAPGSEPPAKEASPTETSAADAPAAEEGLDEPPPPYVERYADAAYDERGGDESAIDYFSTGRARGFADRRGLAAGLLALVLALTLAMQWVVAQRSAIASNLPFAAPLLGAVLAPFGLRIEAPSELDALTIESFELHASAAPDVLEMRALLRNRADHPVRWPSMQLTLTDPSNHVLVRRALHPDDYLPQDDEARDGGVPPSTEWPLRLALEASELQATGYDYRVQLFYSQERR